MRRFAPGWLMVVAGCSAASGGSSAGVEASRSGSRERGGVSAAAPASASAEVAPSSEAAPTASAPPRHCPAVARRSPLSFSQTGWSGGNAVDWPEVLSAEKDGEKLVAPIVGAIDGAVGRCGAGCQAYCDVVKNDGQVLSVDCAVVRAASSYKAVQRNVDFTFRREERGWTAADIAAFSRSGPGLFGGFAAAPTFFAIGDDQVIYGFGGEYFPSTDVLKGGDVRGQLACDGVLATDVGADKGPLSHGARRSDTSRAPVFYGGAGDRGDTARALNGDIDAWVKTAGSTTCRVMTSTPELASVLCLPGLDTWVELMPQARAQPSDPAVAMGATYRLTGAKPVTLKDLTGKVASPASVIADRCARDASGKPLKKRPSYTEADLSAFALTRKGVLFAVPVTIPDDETFGGPRTRLCFVPWSALKTSMSAIASK